MGAGNSSSPSSGEGTKAAYSARRVRSCGIKMKLKDFSFFREGEQA